MTRFPIAWAVGVVAAVCPAAPAAVVAVLNATSREVVFTVEHPGGKPAGVTLAAGEVRAVPVGREPVLRITLNGKPQAFKLDPYTPYLLVEHDDRRVTFRGVDLAADLPPPDDVPAAPPPRPAVTLAVRLYGDQGHPLTPEAWAAATKARFAAAAEVVEKQTGVRFEVAGTGGWASPADAPDLAAVAAGFRDHVAVKAGEKAVGFTCRPLKDAAVAAPVTLGGTHLLVRDSQPKAEAERVEVLVQQLGTVLGAVRSPDRGSVMRAKVGDGSAIRRDFRVQFDPLNLLVLNVWAEELAAGRGPKPADLSAKAVDRLAVLYQTLAGVNEATKTGDGSAADLAEQLALAGGNATHRQPAQDPARPTKKEGAKADPAAEAAAVRAVVRAVTAMATSLADARPGGDDLTAAYVQAAAIAAEKLDKAVRVKAFVVGLGIALDDSTVLRDKPIVKTLCLAAEPDAERAERLKVLGAPTVRGRRDLCQHFAVSAALAELFGATAAEFAGVSKELVDLRGASGFSFADLAANLAGIEYAAAVRDDPKRIAAAARAFAVEDHVPDVTGLADGLTAAQFKADYGGPTDPRFTRAVGDVRAAVKAAKAYEK